ncbi:ankyrin repeat-containing domain protein [Xylaria telfairii]|nr:ankyrin repeat-containing domain protein [Xylaria telfairii]
MRLIDVDTYQPEFARQVDYTDRWGRSPLWHAAPVGATAAAVALLELGAQVNLMDDEGLTPLHAAARGGHDATFQTLLVCGANPCFDTQLLGLTPLHLVVLFGHRKCVLLLLSFFAREGAAVVRNISNVKIHTKAIHLATAGSHLDIVQELQRASAVVATACDDASNVEAVAERYGYRDIVAFLQSLKNRSTVNVALPPRPESELRHDPRSSYPAQPPTGPSSRFSQVPYNSSLSGLYQSAQPILETTHLQPSYVQPTQSFEHMHYYPPPALTYSPIQGNETATRLRSINHWRHIHSINHPKHTDAFKHVHHTSKTKYFQPTRNTSPCPIRRRVQLGTS